MESRDRLGDERRDGEPLQLRRERARRHRLRRKRVGDEDLVDVRAGEHVGRRRREHAVRGHGDHARSAPIAARARRARDGRATGDQVVDDDRDAPLHGPDEACAAHDPAAAVLLRERRADRAAERGLEPLAERLGALDAAGIRRDHGHRQIGETRCELGDEPWRRLQVRGAAAERVLERGEIVHVERDDAVGADRLEQLGDVARRHRVARLGAPVLAGVAHVGNHRGHARSTGVPDGRHEEQQPDQPVVDAVAAVGEERLQYVHVASADARERPGLVLAVLEHPRLERGEVDPQRGGDVGRERAGGFRREQHGCSIVHDPGHWRPRGSRHRRHAAGSSVPSPAGQPERRGTR